MNAFNKQRFNAELDYYTRQLNEVMERLSRKYEWNLAYEEFAVFEISLCAEMFAFVHEQLVALNITDITQYEADATVIAEHLKKSESIKRPDDHAHMDNASFKAFCEVSVEIFCETAKRHKSEKDIYFSELKKELVDKNCLRDGADEDPELYTVLFFLEFIIETVILAYKLYLARRERYTSEQFLSRPNEIYPLIIEARNKIRQNHQFTFCTSIGILCWFEMVDKEFNLDATINCKKLLHGQFLEDESVKVHYWLGPDFWLGRVDKSLKLPDSDSPLTPDIILTSDTTEEAAIDALGEHLYREFVFNFEELLRKYEPPKEPEAKKKCNEDYDDLFPPVSQEFLDIVHRYCDETTIEWRLINGNTYLKRLEEMGKLDLRGFCGALNYIFFTGREVFTPDIFGEYTVDEVVNHIRAKSVLGGALKD